MHALRELSVAPIALAGLTFALDAAWAQGTEYRAGKSKSLRLERAPRPKAPRLLAAL